MNKNHESKKTASKNSDAVAILGKTQLEKVTADSWLGEGGRVLTIFQPFYGFCGFEAEMANRYHGKAMKAHQSAVRYGKVAGKYLIQARKKVGHGNFKAWLAKYFKGSQTTANGYMRIASRWNELEHDPDLSIREALKALVTRTRAAKEFNRDDVLRSKLLKQILGIAWKDWTSEEIEYLQFHLAFDVELEELIVRAMRKLRQQIQEALGKKTIPMQLEEARQRLHQRLWANSVN